MRTLFGLVLMLFVGSAAVAEVKADNLLSAEIGIRQQSATTDATTASLKSQMGYQLGVSAIIPMSNMLGGRTGLFYVNRPIQFSDDASGNSANVSFTSLDVPLELSYQIGDYAYIYGGVIASMNLDASSNDNSTIKPHGTNSFQVPIQIGAQFKFAPSIGADVFFETSGANAMDHVSNLRAVGVNLTIGFD